MNRYTGYVLMVVLALACPGAVLADAISYHPITNDVSSEISSSKVYTHAIDFGNDSPAALINGVQFQTGQPAFGPITGTSATVGTGTTTIPTPHNGDNNAAPYLNGALPCDMEALVKDMTYNNATAVITLTGLTPGQPYRFRLYNRQWGAGAGSGRGQDIGFDTDGVGADLSGAEHTAAFEADDASQPDPSFDTFSQVYALTYDYTLSPGISNLTVYVNMKAGDSGTYHMYGLTNEESGPDTTPPILVNLNPTNNADGVYPGADLVATFSENIELTGSGTLTIKDLDDGTGASDVVLDLSHLPDPNGGVTVSGPKLTIDPTTNFAFGTGYAVQISSNAIVDLADTPNAFGGITNDTTWAFTTAVEDLSAPVVTGTDPTNGASGVVPDALLVATFDEQILLGSGTITITNLTDATNLTTMAVTNDSQISITDNVLTITPPVMLEGGKTFAVLIDAGAVKNFSEVGFGGISDNTTWRFSVASETTYSGEAGSYTKDTWNKAANWDNGIPTGPMDAIIAEGEYASVSKNYSGVDTPVYTGDLTLSGNATLEIASASVDADLNALGGGTITMHSGSIMAFRRSADTSHDQDIVMAGDARIDLCRSTSAHQKTRTFNGTISGSGRLSILGVSRNWGIFTATNSAWSGGLRAFSGTSQIRGDASGCFGTGDVTIDDSMSLQLEATDAIDNGATLHLNGSKGQIENKLILNADDTIGALNVDGFAYAAGTYGRVGGPAAVDVEVAWISGDSVLTVLTDPGDTNHPTTVAITDNSVNGEIFLSLQPVTYALTFNEPVTTTATTADFENSASAPVTIDSVTQTSATAVRVIVTATGPGSIILRIKASAVFEDLYGHVLAVPVTDNDTITARELSLTTRLGILDLTANNGVNPATGHLWQGGDTYRFIFASSTMTNATRTDMAWYNAYVQGLANASPLGIGAAQGATWKIAGSSATVSARENTATDPVADGTGGPVYLLDGTSLIAANHAALWGSGTHPNTVKISETGGSPAKNTTYGDTWTGSNGDGTIHGTEYLGAANVMCGLWPHNSGAHWFLRWSGAATEVRPVYGLSMPLKLTGPGGSVLVVR